ncbi:hypothetical protein MKZ24_22080 [Paenibacillus sp. FSL R7-0297]|uniref:hypothetical protein n=1 Tax=Paenibacillus sp. FSL R7-0297 TaxID=2921680 RepID=UPI0030F52F57
MKRYEQLIEGHMSYPKLMYTVMTEEMKYVKVIHDCMNQSADSLAMQGRVDRFLAMRFVPFLLKLVQRGKEEQYVAEDLKEDELFFYFNMYQKAMIQFQETGPSDHPVISEERFIQFFFKGLMGDMRDAKSE